MSSPAPVSLNLPPLPPELKGAADVEVLKQAFVAMHLYYFELAAACFDEVVSPRP